MRSSIVSRPVHRLVVAAVVGAAALAPTAALADEAADPAGTSPSHGPGTGSLAESPGETDAGQEQQDVDVDEDVPDENEVEPPSGSETPAPVPGQGTPEPEAQQPAVGEDASKDSDERVEVAAIEPILPDMGLGKFNQPVRIGVDLAEGTYVPAGVTTAGSTLRITETGPDVEGGTRTSECTTDASTAVGTATYCLITDQDDPDPGPFAEGGIGLRVESLLDAPLPSAVARQLRGVSPAAVVVPENPDTAQNPQVYQARRTSTVTVTQISAADGLVADPEPAVVAPCGVEFIPDLPIPIQIPTDSCTRQVALLEDTGLPPEATDDEASTDEDTPVVVDVLANDDPVAGAPIDSVQVYEASNGSAELIGESLEDIRVRYVPANGFSGTDTFQYEYSTPNGTATATVTVDVEAAPSDAKPAAGSTVDTRPATVSALPDAGGPGLGMFAWSAGLVAAGAGALVIGRRRGVVVD